MVLVCLLAAAAALGSAYQSTVAAQVDGVISAGTAGVPFAVPPSSAFSSPSSGSEMMPLLAAAARRARVNVFRLAAGYTRGGVPEITQFAFLTGPTRVFSAYSLRTGHWLTPAQTQTGHAFLSSSATGSPAQAGRLAAVAGGPLEQVRPLGDAYRWTWFAGHYTVEAKNLGAAERFLATFSQMVDRRLGLHGSARYTPSSFRGGQSNFVFPPGFGVPGYAFVGVLPPLTVGAAAVLAVVMLYASFSRAKRMAIMRLSGLSPLRIWWVVVGSVAVTTISACLVAVTLLTSIWGPGTGLTARALEAEVPAFAAVAAGSAVAWAYAARLRVAEGIKQRTHSGFVLGVNLVLKVAVLSAAALLSLGSWAAMSKTLGILKQIKGWSAPSSAFQRYGIFANFQIGRHMVDAVSGVAETGYVTGRWLYPYLDRRGAVLVEATQFKSAAHQTQSGQSGFPVLNVNRNYLRAFPVLAAGGSTVHVPETSSTVLLVPVRYRSDLGAILDQVRRQQPPWGFATSRSTKVVWIADQSLQTLDPLVSQHSHDRVTDPVVQVVTLQNTLPLGRAGATGGPDAALKIPLGSSLSRTYRSMLPELRSLRVADQFVGLDTIATADKAFVAQLRHELYLEVSVALAFLASGVLLDMACIAIVVARYRRVVLVRRLFGLGMLRTYPEWRNTLAATVAGQLAIGLLVVLGTGASAAFAWRLLAIAAAFTAVELVVSGLAVARTEQRTLSTALKEGV